jgi:hypothetical protein
VAHAPPHAITSIYTTNYTTNADANLFYSTFADIAAAGALGLLVFAYAQGRVMPEARPRYQPTELAP